MTFSQMQYFIEVANCCSFSKAAQNLYISQPNLTKYIANLEKELGMRLFDRSTHHVKLTQDGQLLLQKTELLFSQLSRSIEEVQLMSKNESPLINITIGISMDEIIPHYLLNFFYQKNTGNTNFRYTLIEDTFAGLIQHFRDRKYDLVISTDRNIRNIAGADHFMLRPGQLLLAVNKKHPLAYKPNLKPIDFGNEPVFFSLPDGKDSPQYVLDSVFSHTGGVVNLQLMNSPADLMLNVQVGAGIALVSSMIDQSKYPDIEFRSYDSNRGMFQFIAWRSDDDNPAVLDVVEFVKRVGTKEPRDGALPRGQTPRF